MISTEERSRLIRKIMELEKLRPLGRFERLLRRPLRTIPYYVLAAVSHIRPFKLSFKTLWGKKMSCYLPEGNTFLYYGTCEANLTNYLLRNLKEGATFIDIGAHVGFYTMLASELVGESGSVHSFEPTPWTFGLLSKNALEQKNATLNNIAAADKNGKLAFLDYGPGYGAYNTSHKNGASMPRRTKGSFEVEALRLDDYFETKGIRPTFIKIDAEGADSRVLEGMKRCLECIKPAISLEVAGDEEWAENRSNAFNILSEFGYLPFSIGPDGVLRPCQLEDSYSYNNLLFIPK